MCDDVAVNAAVAPDRQFHLRKAREAYALLLLRRGGDRQLGNMWLSTQDIGTGFTGLLTAGQIVDRVFGAMSPVCRPRQCVAVAWQCQ